MRLDPLLDSFYVLSSLWGMPGSQVCSLSPAAISGTVDIASAPVPMLRAGVTAFVDVTVVPMDTERVLPNHTVLVEGGRITALGPVGQVKVPAGSVQIDGRGKYLMPGLSDVHTHNGSVTPTFAAMRMGRARDLANGVTLIRYNTPVDLTLKQLWHDSMPPEAPSPRLYLAPRVPLSIGSDSMVATVTAAKAAGYNHVILWNGYGTEHGVDHHPVAYDSLLVAARRVGLPIGAHDAVGSFEKLLALGSAGGSNEHIYQQWYRLTGRPKRPTASDAALPDLPPLKLQEIAAVTKRAGLWISPTVRCTEGVWAQSPAHLKSLRQVVKALKDAGVGLLLGQDDGWDAHDELAALVRAGLSPYEALRTGTYNVAQYLGELDTRGTVAVGRRADLVLLFNNPLADVRHAREPAGVMLGGLWRDRAALDRVLLTTSDRYGPWLMWAVMAPPIREVLEERMQKEAPNPRLEQGSKKRIAAAPLEAYIQTFKMLTDSLDAARLQGRETESAIQQLRDRMAGELGAVRRKLGPEQHEVFDPIVRVWLREQARRGYRVTVPSVTGYP